MHNCVESNTKPDYDVVLQQIADYIFDTPIDSAIAYETATMCLLDTLGCAMLALNFPKCANLLGPVVPGAEMADGVKIPGTRYVLDPVQAAFNIGTMLRWLDFNDTWLAAEWGHPSDNLGAILAAASYAQTHLKQPITMHTVLTVMIKAHEIQGVMALENSFNRVGLDHVTLVKLASTAVAGWIMGLEKEQLLAALSQVCVDGQSLRTYRHAPNAGSRKSWAAGDATARAMRLVLWTKAGEMGYPSALTAPRWGFYDVSFSGKPFTFQRPFASYVMENVLFKLSFPAEFHAQTAVECAVQLHPLVRDRLSDIARIEIVTHESAIRIISKQGTLHNPADRDHCLQYMVAIGLIHGTLHAHHYEDEAASDPRIDQLRSLMAVREDKNYSADYHDPEKRSIANRIRVVFQDGSMTDEVAVEYPIGHKRRRDEGWPILLQKSEHNLKTRFSAEKTRQLLQLFRADDFTSMSVNAFLDQWVAQ